MTNLRERTLLGGCPGTQALLYTSQLAATSIIQHRPPSHPPSLPISTLPAVSFKTVGYKSGNVEKHEEFKFDGFPIGSILISRLLDSPY
jgi:hypothetical protein